MTRFWIFAAGVVPAMVGCSGSSDVDYKFGAGEMEQVAIGTWSGVWGSETIDAGAGEAAADDAGVGEAGTSDGGTGLVPFTLVIERALRTSSHPLCDPRPLSSNSSASLHPLCVSTSEMPVRATLDVSDGSFVNAELVGMLRVPGAELREADLSLKGTSADVSIVAQWVVGKWLFCVANHATGQPLAACRIDARSP